MTKILSHLVGYPFKTAQQDAEPFRHITSFVKDLGAKKESDRFVDNPIITDETAVKQCDLKYLLSEHPDINGLSLLLDDVAREERLSTVSFEDFMEPKDHYDIFDMQEFIENAKRQFKKLPIDFRLKYNNNPLELVNALDDPKKNTAALADLERYLSPLMPQSQSSGITNVASQTSQDSSDQSKTTKTTKVVSESSTSS